MKIKDVEQLTGLTAKSIRYYEAKGLLQVEREAENSYRTYSEENVQELKRIKLLRFLDFSVDQIREMQQMDEAHVKTVLLDKAEELEDQSQNMDIKKNLCHTLSKDGLFQDSVVEEYNEAIDAMECVAFDDFTEVLKDLRCPSLTEVIAETLIFAGPILWLFINIHNQKWHGLLWNAGLAVLFTACLTGNWINYWHKRKYQPKRVKKNNHATWYLFPAAVIGGIVSIILIIMVETKLHMILAPEDWLFYEMKPWAGNLMIYCTIIPVMFLFSVFIVFVFRKCRRNKGEEDAVEVIGLHTFRKYWYLLVVLWVMAAYLSLINVTYVTEDRIIQHSTFCPWGKAYSYSDVTKISTGFGGKTISLHNYQQRGNFSYRINIGEKQIVFSTPTINEEIARYEEDTYLELEEFDQRLIQYGIAKESDDANAQDCDFEKQYVDRFLRIIRNR